MIDKKEDEIMNNDEEGTSIQSYRFILQYIFYKGGIGNGTGFIEAFGNDFEFLTNSFRKQIKEIREKELIVSLKLTVTYGILEYKKYDGTNTTIITDI